MKPLSETLRLPGGLSKTRSLLITKGKRVTAVETGR